MCLLTGEIVVPFNRNLLVYNYDCYQFKKIISIYLLQVSSRVNISSTVYRDFVKQSQVCVLFHV